MTYECPFEAVSLRSGFRRRNSSIDGGAAGGEEAAAHVVLEDQLPQAGE
jgi:hypothetical protein